MTNTTFNKTIAISGAILHASLSNLVSKISLTNVHIEGPEDL